jgi:hypothetical protein
MFTIGIVAPRKRGSRAIVCVLALGARFRGHDEI